MPAFVILERMSAQRAFTVLSSAVEGLWSCRTWDVLSIISCGLGSRNWSQVRKLHELEIPAAQVPAARVCQVVQRVLPDVDVKCHQRLQVLLFPLDVARALSSYLHSPGFFPRAFLGWKSNTGGGCIGQKPGAWK